LLHKDRLDQVLKSFNGKRILVVGDLMVDRYVEVAARKISREAPVPVGDLKGESSFLGGAGNLASNIVALGGRASVAGVIGEDSQGDWVLKALRDKGIDPSAVVLNSRPTTLKTRYIVNQFQVLRIDRELRSDVEVEITDRMLESITNILPAVDYVAVADYDKGAVTAALIDGLVELSKQGRKGVIAQPKVRHYLDFRGVNQIKSNEREASIATGISVLNETGLRNIGINLMQRLECNSILLTRGEKGMTLFEENLITNVPPLLGSKNYLRAVGVRDAVTSVIALGVSAGASMLEATALGNIAAAVKGDAVGTVVVTVENLRSHLEDTNRIFDQIVEVPVRR
jgi:D-beta-D-heptose 7-phosphate kinase/D-beta-D-heptose 1-phosphate adenosyltransferase